MTSGQAPMERYRFDRFVEHLDGEFTRRQTIKTVLGGLVGAGAGMGRLRPMEAVASAQGSDDGGNETFADLALGTLAMLGVMDDGLDYSAGTVYRTEEAFAQSGATSQSLAPLIFGEAGSRNVRFDSFLAPDGSHNVYVYLIETPRGVGVAENLARRLAEQSAQPEAEDVTKELPGWDVNVAQRFSFPTEEGEVSRIQAFAAVGFVMAIIIDDLYGNRKNSVTLYRKMLNALATVFPSGFDPKLWDTTQQLPGARLAGLLPIVSGVTRVNWIPVAVNMDVVARYNMESSQTAEALGGATNAFNASYIFDRNGIPHAVYGAVREFQTEDAVQSFVAGYEETVAASDARINARRRRLNTEFANPYFAAALADVVAWKPTEDVRLVGSDLIVIAGLLVIDLAVFVGYDGDPETFDDADPLDLDQYEELLDLAAEILGSEPTPMERYQSPPGNASFRVVPPPTGEASAVSTTDDPPAEAGPTGFVNIAGGLLYQADFATLEGDVVRHIVKGTYYDLNDGVDPLDARGLSEMLRQAGLEDVACLRVGALNEAGGLTDARTSAFGWALNPDRAFTAFEETRDFLSIFAERPLAALADYPTIPYYGAVLNGSAIGPSFPARATLGIAQTGTIVVGLAVEGVDESLVEQGIGLMLDRLRKDEIPGDFLSRKIVLPRGDNWGLKVDLTYTCLEGVVQYPIGLTDDQSNLFTRRNEGARNVLQARRAYTTGRNDVAAGLDLQIRSYYDSEAARAFYENYEEDFEDDFGVRPIEIDMDSLISGSDRSRAFLSSQQSADGVRDDALLMVVHVGSYVPILRFGLKTLPSADDVRDAFLRDTSGALIETGRDYMTEQVRVLNDDDPGIFRARPVYSFL